MKVRFSEEATRYVERERAYLAQFGRRTALPSPSRSRRRRDFSANILALVSLWHQPTACDASLQLLTIWIIFCRKTTS